MESGFTADLSLAQRVAAGNEAAFALFYDRYADLLFAFVMHHLPGSRADAEDVWQEALVAGVRGVHAYRGEASLFTWLCSIARHKIADHLRLGSRPAADVFADLPEPQLAALRDTAPLPEEVALERSVQARVIEAVGALNDDYRIALLARYVQGESVSQVARRLGRSYKATESLLSRAREALRNTLIQMEEMR